MSTKISKSTQTFIVALFIISLIFSVLYLDLIFSYPDASTVIAGLIPILTLVAQFYFRKAPQETVQE